MAEFIAFLITLGIFVGLPAWLIWSVISRSKKKEISKEKAEPVIKWAEFKGYPLPDKPYGLLFNIGIICGFLCGLIPGLIFAILHSKEKITIKKR